MAWSLLRVAPEVKGPGGASASDRNLARGGRGAALRSEPEIPARRRRDVIGRLPLGLLAWFLVVIFALTWTPTRESGARLQVMPPTEAREVLGNLLLVGPVAIVAALTAKRLLGATGALRFATLAAGLVSLTAELGQVFVDGRTVSLYDLALNTAGGAFAAGAALRLVRRGMASGAVLTVTGATVFAGALVLLVRASSGLQIQGWDPSYQVVAGEEVGGVRPYVGTVSSALVCTGRGASERCATPGAYPDLTLDLARLAEESGRVRLSATVLSRSDVQEGPARIVSFSAGTALRNATLGQAGDTLVLRVRTPHAGPNGNTLEFLLPGAVPVEEVTAVAASYRPGHIELRAEGASGVRSATFPSGVLSGWWLTRPPPPPTQKRLLPGELSRARLVGALALLLPMGLAAAWLPRIGPATAAVLAPPLTLGVLAMVEFALGAAIGPMEIGLALLLALVGVSLGRWDRTRLAKPVPGS